MTVRAANLAKADVAITVEQMSAADDLDDIELLPLPRYLDVMPKSPQAKQIMAEWKPRLYGYGSHVVEPLLETLPKPKTFRPTTLLDDEPFVAPIAVTSRYHALETRVKAEQGAALDDAFSKLQKDRRGRVIKTHLDQLVRMFRHLAGPKPKEHDIYRSSVTFVGLGLGTARKESLLFARLIGDIVSTDKSPTYMREVFANSPHLSSFASLSIEQAPSVDGALGVITDDKALALDTAAFALDTSGPKHSLASIVPLLDLRVITTSLWTGSGYNFKNASSIRDLEPDDDSHIGCLALMKPSKKGPTAFRRFDQWIGDVVLESGVWAEHRAARISGEHQPNYFGRSLAAHMIRQGLHLSTPSQLASPTPPTISL